MAALTLLIVVGPILGEFAGLMWSTLIFAFGGGFSADPVYYGIVGGTYGAAFLFLMIVSSFADAETRHAPPTPQDSQITKWLRRIRNFKVSGQIMGHGVSVEATMRDDDEVSAGAEANKPGQ